MSEFLLQPLQEFLNCPMLRRHPPGAPLRARPGRRPSMTVPSVTTGTPLTRT